MRSSNKPLLLISLLVALALCWVVGTVHDSAAAKKQVDVPATKEELQEIPPYLSIKQLDEETEMTAPVDIDLSQSEDGYEITTGGQFRLTGELRGTLVIRAEEQNVHLFLDNVSITSKSGPAVYCHDTNKLIITLLPGTENRISDSGDYRADEDVEACIYSECGITFNGTGELVVNGHYKDAIKSKDVVKVLDGVYTLKCKRTGIHGNDGILISGGNFMISSEKYGLKTSKSGAEGRGTLIITGGEFSIIAGRYSFVVTKANLVIYDCTIFERSVAGTYDVGGIVSVQEGCVQS